MYGLDKANDIFNSLLVCVHDISNANPGIRLSSSEGDLFCVASESDDPWDILLCMEALTPSGLQWFPIGIINRWGDFQVIEKASKISMYVLARRHQKRFYGVIPVEKEGNT